MSNVVDANEAAAWESLPVGKLQISSGLASVLEGLGILNVGLLLQYLEQGDSLLELPGLTPKAEPIIFRALGMVADSFPECPWDKANNRVDDGTASAASVDDGVAVPSDDDGVAREEEPAVETPAAEKFPEPAEKPPAKKKTEPAATLPETVNGDDWRKWNYLSTHSEADRMFAHAKKLDRTRQEVCEVAQQVYEAEQELERAKEYLADKKAEQKAAAARLYSLEHEDPAQLELFDKDDQQPEGEVVDSEFEVKVDSTPASWNEDNWTSAPISVLELTEAQANNFAASGVETMVDFENLRAGITHGELKGKGGLESVKRLGKKLDDIRDKATAWLQNTCPAYLTSRPPESTDPPSSPATTPAAATPESTGTVPAPTVQPDVQSPPMKGPAAQQPQQVPPPDVQPPKDDKPTRIQLTADVPGCNNDTDGLYAGCECDVVGWVIRSPIVKSPKSGKQTLVKEGAFDVLA